VGLGDRHPATAMTLFIAIIHVKEGNYLISSWRIFRFYFYKRSAALSLAWTSLPSLNFKDGNDENLIPRTG